MLIKNALLGAALANEDPITYVGTSFDITLQKITSKYLATKVVQNNQLNSLISNTDVTQTDFLLTTYKINPYSTDENWPTDTPYI